MSQKHHVNPPSYGRKGLPAHARPSKPAPLKRLNSHNRNQSHDTGSASSKLGPGSSKKVGTIEVVQQDEEAEDMASFLQFCATCERQIVTPGTSILYCSEACRKKDASRPRSLQAPLTPSGISTTPCYFDAHTPDIIPQRSPTMLRPVSLTFSDLSLDDYNSSGDEHDDCPERPQSEAIDFATQFRSDTWHGDASVARRPRVGLTSAPADSSTLPSLINSPSSSISTMASVRSARPLPSRRNKSYSSYASMPIDLLTSYPTTAPSSPTQLAKDASLKSQTSTLTSFRVAEAGALSYDKCSTSRQDSGAQGSLKQLFSHEAMKAPPSDASQVAPNAWSGL